MMYPTPLIYGDLLVWAGDTLPTLSTDGAYTAGSLFLNVKAANGVPSLWRCTASGTPGTWEPVAQGVRKVASKAANYTLTVNDDVIILTANAVVTLPAATAVPSGKEFTVKRIGAGNGSLAGAIDGGATSAAFGTDKASVSVYSDGTAWYVRSTFGTVTIT